MVREGGGAVEGEFAIEEGEEKGRRRKMREGEGSFVNGLMV